MGLLSGCLDLSSPVGVSAALLSFWVAKRVVLMRSAPSLLCSTGLITARTLTNRSGRQSHKLHAHSKTTLRKITGGTRAEKKPWWVCSKWRPQTWIRKNGDAGRFWRERMRANLQPWLTAVLVKKEKWTLTCTLQTHPWIMKHTLLCCTISLASLKPNLIHYQFTTTEAVWTTGEILFHSDSRLS